VGAALLTVALTLSIVYAGSAIAGKKGVGEDTEVFSLGIGTGPAQIGYAEGNGDVDAWGPFSFTVLNNGNIAVLDGANRRILVVNESGEEVKSVPFSDLGLVRPVDIREWRGRLAVSEGNTTPQAIVLVNLNSWRSEERIEVPDALVELGGLLEETSDGGLQLVVGSAEAHLLATATKGYGKATMRLAQSAIDVPSVGRVAVETGDPAKGVGHTIRMTQAPEGVQVARSMSASGLAATHLKVVGSSKDGNLLVKTAYWLPKGDDYEIRFYIEELSRGTLETVACATLPVGDFFVTPDRYVAVDRQGRVWSMVPTRDEVSFHILTPSPGAPDVTSGSLARRMTSVVQAVGSAFSKVFKTDAAMADGSYTTPWTRTQGRSVALGYYYLYWYCNSEAYYRSCGTPGGSGLDGNGRPDFITTYNTTYQWAPYAWGHWNTSAEIYNYVGTSGHDAGDSSGGYDAEGNAHYTLSCVYGVDCSGLVSRVWGLTSWKHGTSTLPDHATMLSDSGMPYSMTSMDVCLHSGHVVLYDGSAGGDTFYVIEATTEGYDRVVRHVHDWSVMKAEDSGWHGYRYNNWTS
jgi:hypothetical protein